MAMVLTSVELPEVAVVLALENYRKDTSSACLVLVKVARLDTVY